MTPPPRGPSKRPSPPKSLTCPVGRLERVPGPVDAVGGVAGRSRGGLRVGEVARDERVERGREEDRGGDAGADDVEAGDGHFVFELDGGRGEEGEGGGGEGM